MVAERVDSFGNFGGFEFRLLCVAAAACDLAGWTLVAPSEVVMHLLGWLPEGCDDRVAARSAAEHGVSVAPLSMFTVDNALQPALVLGYTSVDEADIRSGVQRLARALQM